MIQQIGEMTMQKSINIVSKTIHKMHNAQKKSINYWSSLSPLSRLKPCRNRNKKNLWLCNIFPKSFISVKTNKRIQIYFTSCKCCIVWGWYSPTSPQVLRSRSVIPERWIFFSLCEVSSGLVGWLDINKTSVNWITPLLKMDGFAIKHDLHL